MIQCDIPLTKSKYSLNDEFNIKYTPDFIIGDNVYEIKNSYFLKKIDFSNIEDCYNKRGYKFNILTDHDFDDMCITILENEYIKGFVEFASDKKYKKYIKKLEDYYHENS